MELDTPTTERPPGLGELNAGGWFSDASRFEEVQDEAAGAAAAAETEGGMDVD